MWWKRYDFTPLLGLQFLSGVGSMSVPKADQGSLLAPTCAPLAARPGWGGAQGEPETLGMNNLGGQARTPALPDMPRPWLSSARGIEVPCNHRATAVQLPCISLPKRLADADGCAKYAAAAARRIRPLPISSRQRPSVLKTTSNSESGVCCRARPHAVLPRHRLIISLGAKAASELRHKPAPTACHPTDRTTTIRQLELKPQFMLGILSFLGRDLTTLSKFCSSLEIHDFALAVVA